MSKVWVLIAIAALASCAARPSEPVSTASSFDRFLAIEYDRLADAEYAESDWFDGLHFRRKADAARLGDAPAPDTLEERDVPAGLAPEIAPARDRLDVVLQGTARLVDPEALASAQAAFDCWIQEAEEDLQADEITACRDRFMADIVKLEEIGGGAVVVLLPSDEGSAVSVERDGDEVRLDTPYAGVAATGSALGEARELDESETNRVLESALSAAPQPERSYLVYFQEGSTDLTPESDAVFKAALADALETEAARMTVFGHTDRQGPASLNVRLARARAEAIRLQIIAAGVPESAIAADSFGESLPLVPTDDGVAEPRNRRVEIAVR